MRTQPSSSYAPNIADIVLRPLLVIRCLQLLVAARLCVLLLIDGTGNERPLAERRIWGERRKRRRSEETRMRKDSDIRLG
jgi:hypothetical protein